MNVSTFMQVIVDVAANSHVPEPGQLFVKESTLVAAESADHAFIEVRPVAVNHDMTVPDIAASDVLVATIVPALLLSVLF